MIMRAGDEQAAIIGAQIERGIEGAAMLARIGGGKCPLVRQGRGRIAPCPLRRSRTGRSTDGRLVQRREPGRGPIGIGHRSLLSCAVAELAKPAAPGRTLSLRVADDGSARGAGAQWRDDTGQRCRMRLQSQSALSMQCPRRTLHRPAPYRRALPGPLLGNSSTVEQRTLTPSILVRLQVPQPKILSMITRT